MPAPVGVTAKKPTFVLMERVRFFKTLIAVCLGGLACPVACQAPSSVYENVRFLPREQWERDAAVTFQAALPDRGSYRMEVLLRHSIDYPLANLGCLVEIIPRHRKPIRDTLHILLSDTTGTWLGTGGAVLKTYVHPFRQAIRTGAADTVTVAIRHLMHNQVLSGIKNIGIRITRCTDESDLSPVDYGKE